MKITETNFLEQLQLHSEKALSYVIDEYGGFLMAAIRKHLYRLPNEQEECFNDVLLNIWENCHSFDEARGSFKNWAIAVARYRALDYLRHYRNNLQELRLEEQVLSSNDHDLEKLLEQEISEELEQMLSCLSPVDRQLFLRLYGEEESLEQVSKETGLKKDVIYNRISRGKKKIRKIFSDERSLI